MRTDFLTVKYSDVPFYLFLVWAAFYLVAGKNVDAFTLNIADMPVRFTHVAIIVLSYLTLPLFKTFGSLLHSKGKAVVVSYVVYLGLGLLALAVGFYNGAGARYVLGTAGIFYNAIFFYFGFVLINTESRLLLLLKVLLYSWVIGSLVFIISYVISSKGVLPFGIHLSSDILPMIAGVILVMYALMPQTTSDIRGFRFIAFYAFAFVLMVGTRGVLLSTVVLLFFSVTKNYLKSRKSGLLFELRPKISSLFIVFSALLLTLIFREQDKATQILDVVPMSEGGRLNILYRLYMWRDIWGLISSNYFMGHGLVPFISTTMEQIFVTIPEMSQNVNPHNSYLNLAYYGGIIAPLTIMFFVYAIGRMIEFNLSKFQGLAFAIYISAGVLFITALSTPVLELFYLAPYAWALLGVACQFATQETAEIQSVNSSLIAKES